MDANGSRAYVPYHVTENSMNIVPKLCHEYITLAEVEVVHHRECEKKKGPYINILIMIPVLHNLWS